MARVASSFVAKSFDERHRLSELHWLWHRIALDENDT
jgi:hypothetical protein